MASWTDSPLLVLGGLRAVALHQRLAGDAGDQVQQRIAGTVRRQAGVAFGRSTARNELVRAAGAVQVALGRLLGHHVGHQKDQQRDADERHAAGREIRLQQRPADHHRIHQQPNQKEPADAEQPDEADLLCRVRQLRHLQARRERDQPEQVQIPHAPHAAELEVDGDRQQRREVDPRRRIELLVAVEKMFHRSRGCKDRPRFTALRRYCLMANSPRQRGWACQPTGQVILSPDSLFPKELRNAQDTLSTQFCKRRQRLAAWVALIPTDCQIIACGTWPPSDRAAIQGAKTDRGGKRAVR